MRVAIGLDVGTTGVKAIAVAEDGAVVARAEHGYPLSTPAPGWSEQDPGLWWNASAAALAEVAAGREVAGIGLSGQMHGLVCLDSAGEVIRPAILWNDQRTGAECAEIEERVGLDRLIELTGNRALPGFTAPKLLWLRNHEPASYSRIERVMLPKDYVRLRLTGEGATDVADASGTLLLDVARRTWSADVLDALDLPAAWLPPVLESPAVSGHVAADLASDKLSQAGVDVGALATVAGVPVAAGAGDCAAAAVGVGAIEPGVLSIVLGTSGVVFATLPAYAADSQARVHAFCHAVPDTWHAMGVMLSAAGSLQWFHDAVAGDVAFSTLMAEAEAWAPGVEGLLFAPYLAGERTPHADPDARGAFVGLQLRHDRGALVRAVLEGVAFGLADSYDLLCDLGVKASRASISGGGARGGLWPKIVASVLDLPITATAADEGSAFGAALLGGVAGELFTDVPSAVAQCVHSGETSEPQPEWVAAYRHTRERFKKLYPTLDTLKETVQ
jgi:xylulokinase